MGICLFLSLMYSYFLTIHNTSVTHKLFKQNSTVSDNCGHAFAEIKTHLHTECALVSSPLVYLTHECLHVKTECESANVSPLSVLEQSGSAVTSLVYQNKRTFSWHCGTWKWANHSSLKQTDHCCYSQHRPDRKIIHNVQMGIGKAKIMLIQTCHWILFIKSLRWSSM